MEIILKKKVIVNQEDIDDIMCTALEGGITYWCKHAESTINDMEWRNANNVHWLHEVISRGGEIILTDEDNVKYKLTLHHFMTGLQKLIDESGEYYLEQTNDGYTLETSEIDADIADLIIQYAIFGELVFS